MKELNTNIDLPIVISKDDITNKYFKDKPKTKIHKIHTENKVGLINALWANSYGSGGVLPLQASFIPSNKFLELVLTGSMGEVMKESISVSLTNAWNLTSIERKKYLIEKYNDPKTIIYAVFIFIVLILALKRWSVSNNRFHSAYL